MATAETAADQIQLGGVVECQLGAALFPKTSLFLESGNILRAKLHYQMAPWLPVLQMKRSTVSWS